MIGRNSKVKDSKNFSECNEKKFRLKIPLSRNRKKKN